MLNLTIEEQIVKRINNTKPLIIMAISLSLLSLPTYADWGVGLDLDNQKMQYKHKKNDVELTGYLNLRHRGEKFNIDKGAMSYDFTNSNNYAVEAIIASKNSGFKAKDRTLFNGMTKRKDSIDVGGRVIFDTGVIGSAVFDITKDVHASKGLEANFKIGGISPHAPHWTGERSTNVAAVAGLRYQDAKVIDYYYGVKNAEATASRKAYKGKSAITPFIGVEAQVNITPHVTIDGGLGVSKRAKSIRNSSLTNDKKYDFGANIGISYWF